METYKVIFYILLYSFVAIGFGYWLSRIGYERATTQE